MNFLLHKSSVLQSVKHEKILKVNEMVIVCLPKCLTAVVYLQIIIFFSKKNSLCIFKCFHSKL